MERWLAKLLAAAIILTCNCLAGLLPVKVSGWFDRKGEKGLYYLSLANCFGGGVFFGAYLMHMAPEVRLLMDEVYLTPREISYPLPELLTAVGFFMVLFLDTFVNILVQSRSQKNQIATKSCTVLYDTSVTRVNNVSADDVSGTHDKQVSAETEHGAGSLDDLQLQFPSQGERLDTSEGELREADELLARPFIILVGLSFHFIIEGMTLGLQETTGGVWVLVIAILSHELVISFTFGMRMVRLFSPKQVLVIILIYASAIPLGIFIGTIIFETSGGSEDIDVMSAFLLALSAGIFIYVTFLEILREELTHDTQLSKIVTVTVGFLFMAVMVLVEQALAESTTDGHEVTTEVTHTTVS